MSFFLEHSAPLEQNVYIHILTAKLDWQADLPNQLEILTSNKKDSDPRCCDQFAASQLASLGHRSPVYPEAPQATADPSARMAAKALSVA